MSRETIDNLARRLADAVPQGLRAVRSDLEDNFRGLLASGLARMDLVTREEFAVQEAVLERTRAKLGELERRLAELEDAPATGAATPRTAGKKPPAGKRAGRKKTGGKKTGGKKTAARQTRGRTGGD